MSDKEIKEFIRSFNEYTKEITSTKEKSREYLQDVGLYTKKGTLEKEYKEGVQIFMYSKKDNLIIGFHGCKRSICEYVRTQKIESTPGQTIMIGWGLSSI